MTYKELHINNEVKYNTYYADINNSRYDKLKAFIRTANEKREYRENVDNTYRWYPSGFKAYVKDHKYSSLYHNDLDLFIFLDYAQDYPELYRQLSFNDVRFHLSLPFLSQSYEYVSIPKNTIAIVQEHCTLSFDKKGTSLFNEYQKLYEYLKSLYPAIEEAFTTHKCEHLLEPYQIGLKKFEEFLFTPKDKLVFSTQDKCNISNYVSKDLPKDLSWDIISFLSRHYFNKFTDNCSEYIYKKCFKKDLRTGLEVISAFSSLVHYYTTAFDKLINENLKYNAITIHLEPTSKKVPRKIIEFKASYSNKYEKETNEDFKGIPLYVPVFKINIDPEQKIESVRQYRKQLKNFLYDNFRNYEELTLTYSKDLEKFIVSHTRTAINEAKQMELYRISSFM